jgi:mannose-6-phosphate isomerase-like protein (cupin superfamily)
MSVSTSLSIAFLLFAIFAIRLIPHPERTAHGFGEYFDKTPDPLGSKMIIYPDANEDRFTVMETHGPNCESGNFDSDCAPPYHYHTFQDEDFLVKKGSILMKQEGEIITVNAGDDPVTVPMGLAHTFIKNGEEDAEVVITIRPNPGNNGQRFFPNLFGTIRDGPNPIQIFYILCTHGVRLADIPWPVHGAICLTLRGVAPLLGYHIEYPEYEWRE